MFCVKNESLLIQLELSFHKPIDTDRPRREQRLSLHNHYLVKRYTWADNTKISDKIINYATFFLANTYLKVKNFLKIIQFSYERILKMLSHNLKAQKSNICIQEVY